MKDLRIRVGRVIAEHRLFADGERVMVAVSGGVDSMVLLHLLAQLAEARRWQLAVAHFNHRLRGRASDRDQCFVSQCARDLGLPFYTESGAVRALAKQNKMSLEMAARQARHEFLARAAKSFGAARVALAHHADDQTELFFLRLLRGAGTHGLGGMRPDSRSPADPNLQLIRPLLETSRAEIEAYARQHRVLFREDATNATLEPLRNRLRHQLLPLLKRWQPGLSRTVPRVMAILRDEAEHLEAEAARWRRQKIAFIRLPVAIQRRVLEAQLLELGQAPDFELIEHLRLRPGATLTVAPELGVARHADGTLQILTPKDAPGFHSEILAVALRQRARKVAWGGKTIRWRSLKPTQGSLPSPRPADRELFDADAIGACATLRHWQPGDRFWPIGAPGEVKLQDFFTNQKVPRAERHRRLIATAEDGRIFWVEGMRIAEPFKVTARTRAVLEWRWE